MDLSKRLLGCVLFLFVFGAMVPAQAQETNEGLMTISPHGRPAVNLLVPQPAEMSFSQQRYTFNEFTAFKIVTRDRDVPEGVTAMLSSIRQYLPQSMRSGIGMESPISGGITLVHDTGETRLGREGYRLHVHPSSIDILAATWAGMFNALQTLRQLLPPEIDTTFPRRAWTIPCVSIVDTPRFSWRGMHLDVGRHMYSVDFIKKFIDLLAMYKYNTFHWHLTDDQGWRIEIPKYPKLTSVGAWRKETMGDGKRYGGFYSQKQIREIVSYAADRFITVVPEIEMPGHGLAALAAYPELSCTGGPFEVGTTWGVFDDVFCAGNDRVFEFLQDVLSDVFALFPSKFIHIGGDECPKTRWKVCPRCQARMKKEGLKNEHELQSWFIRRMTKFLQAHDRRLIGWDEILEGGLAPNAAVMSWRGMAGGIEAARAGHDVVMTPTSHCYFDYAQSRSGEPTKAGGNVPADSVYLFEPVPRELGDAEANHVLGAQGNVWTEWMPDEKIVEYMILPRMCALAEVLWSPRAARSLASFHACMAPQYARLSLLGFNYRVPNPIMPQGRVVLFGDSLVRIDNPVSDAVIRYTFDGSEPTDSSAVYSEPIPVRGRGTLTARLRMPDGRGSTSTRAWFYPVDRARNGVTYKYYEGRWTALPDFSVLEPKSGGVLYDLDLQGVPRRADEYGVRFSGSIDMPTTATYTFFLVSDDGGRFMVDGKVIVDNDGLHSRRERSGTVKLTRGPHRFVLDYFESGGDESLELWMQASDVVDDGTPDAHGILLGPAGAKHPVDPAILFRE